MHQPKIKIFTLVIDDYFPELCEMTLKTQRAFARNIGAEHEVLTSRVLTSGREGELSLAYEKAQVWERFETERLDYAIILDADLLISPGLGNPLAQAQPGQVGAWKEYDHQPDLFKNPPEFELRQKAIVTNFLVIPRECRDVLKPFEDDEISRMLGLIARPFCLDEFLITYRATQMGLKNYQTVPDDKHIWHADVTTKPRQPIDVLKSARQFYQTTTDMKNMPNSDYLPTCLNFKGLTGQAVWVGPFKQSPLRHLMLDNWMGRKLFVVNDWNSGHPLQDGCDLLDCFTLTNQKRSHLVQQRSLDAVPMFKDRSLDCVIFEKPPLPGEMYAWASKMKKGGLMFANGPANEITDSIPFMQMSSRQNWSLWEI